MRAFNVLLSILVSLFLALLVFEGGLRLVGMGPPKTLNEFHPTLGWSKRPDASTRRKSSEFDVTFTINSLGLRDDPMDSPAKPQGRYRVVALGDSFTLGFTVSREDLFADQLERWWQAEGRDVDVINTGTEGYSTDQSVVWLQENGADFEPDLVLLFAYENDLYWNGQTQYFGKDKPRFDQDGQLDHAGPFDTPDPGGLEKSLALANLWHKLTQGQPSADLFQPDQGTRPILKEFGVVLPAPPGFVTDAVKRTGGALEALKRTSDELGAKLVVVPIPSHSAVDEQYALGFGRGALGLDRDAWVPELPVDTFLSLAAARSIPTIDPREALREATRSGEDQYFQRDWHLNPAGNATLARVVHDRLDGMEAFGPAHHATTSSDLPAAAAATGGLPFWMKLYAVLFVVLTALHYATYPKLAKWRAPIEVGGMLATVFAIVIFGSGALDRLPPVYSKLILVLFVATILMFIAYKLGRRLGTILELFKAFTLRGHWYLMPLVVVLLSIGSLLVVAASSPLVAPFIYTLF